MDATNNDARDRTSGAFIEETILEAFVPAASQVDVQELLEQWDGEILEDKNTIVPFIEQRQFLLLDEEVPVHVVLRTKLLDEDRLETYLERLTINLEARAYGTLHVKPGENEKSHPANELLYSGSIDQDNEPTICATEVQSNGSSEAMQYAYIFWKLLVPIPRPKAKINKLSIFFTPLASLNAPKSSLSENEDDEYLPSGVPEPRNLLAALADDPDLKGIKPKLQVSALYATTTGNTNIQASRPLRSGSRRLFRAAPAFLWRLRFVPYPSSTETHASIAALDVEITPFANSDVRIDTFDLHLSDGEVEYLGPALPIHSAPGDLSTLLYKLQPATGNGAALNPDRLPDLRVTARGLVLVSDTCMPKLSFEWTTPVELPSSRPTSRAGPSREPAKPLGPDSLPVTDQRTSVDMTTVSANGLVFTITGTDSPKVGESFKWQVFVINRTNKFHRLAIIPIPKSRPWSRHSGKESSSSLRGGDQNAIRKDIAPAVVSDRLLYNMQRSTTQEPTQLICMSPDIRIGPLAPGACFLTDIKFVALSPGVLTLDALRVIDIETQHAVDISHLPDIVAVSSSEPL